MLIEITSVTAPFKDGAYFKMELAFVRDGKAQTRKLVAFPSSKVLFDTLKEAKAKEVYEIDLEKDEKSGFWNWKKATRVDSSSPSAKPSAMASVKSTYETPEERARKQVYIVRQSSISSAIALLGSKAKKEEILTLAEEFAGFVFQSNGNQPVGEDFKDDIPY